MSCPRCDARPVAEQTDVGLCDECAADLDRFSHAAALTTGQHRRPVFPRLPEGNPA